MPAPRKRLGDILIEAQLITPDQLQKALEINRVTGSPTGQVLVSLGLVTDEGIKRALSQQLGLPFISLQDVGVDVQVAKALPEQVAKRYRAIPLRHEDGKLVVAMADPLNVFAIDDIQFTTGMSIKVVLMTDKDLDRAINQVYQIEKIQAQVVQQAQEQQKSGEAADRQRAQAEYEDAPIVQLVDEIIAGAIRDRASDIHVEPLSELLRIRYRIDGVLYDVMSVPVATAPSVISRIKILSGMDIAEKRIPQDGRIQRKLGQDEVDLRVSTLPIIYGEKIAIRLLRKSSLNLSLNQTGMDDETRVTFERLIRRPYGMVLVTGPTGSGKTTTLYSALSTLNSAGKNIVTVEDPVEYRFNGVNQVNVNPKAGLTFASGLRAILRQDPNIIMIGEIRDTETADVAIRAALTGHLMLSTLHTNDAPSSVTRLIEMGVEPYLVASSLLGVVAQRLVRRICPHCRTSYQLQPDDPDLMILGVGGAEPVTVMRGKGCNACNGTGYLGRLGVFEVMPYTKELRRLTMQRAVGDEIKACAIKQGMRTLRQDVVAKCLRGETTVEEVVRMAYDEL